MCLQRGEWAYFSVVAKRQLQTVPYIARSLMILEHRCLFDCNMTLNNGSEVGYGLILEHNVGYTAFLKTVDYSIKQLGLSWDMLPCAIFF